MSSSTNDRNLLVAILALQMDLISRDQLIAAMQAWLLKKSSRIEDILLQNHAIDSDAQSFLSEVADRHIQLHGGDIEKSLASLSSLDSLGQHLRELDDAGIDRTLTAVDSLRLDSTKISANLSQTPQVSGPAPGAAGERFRIIRLHAKGGLGQVFLANDKELHREVALKEIQDQYADNPNNRSQFEVEAEVTGQLEHPGIVPVYSLGHTQNGRPFYVMRFIKGDSLEEAIDRLHSVPLPGNRATARNLQFRNLIRRLVDVCNAVEYAHSRGILHRDLKPGNIMLGKYGETLVVDWGLAKSVGKSGSHKQSDEKTLRPEAASGSAQTRIGAVQGTVAYMSPEQAEGRVGELGPAADVYCLGSTLYHILTGIPPIRSAIPEEALAKARAGDFAPPCEVRKDTDPALNAICQKAMARSPGDRYSTTAELAADLELWLADEPVSPYREPLPVRIGRYFRRHRTTAMTAAGVVIVSVIAMGVIVAIVAANNREMAGKNRELKSLNTQIRQEQEHVQRTRDAYRRLAFDVLDSAETTIVNIPGVEVFRTEVMETAYDALLDLHEEAPNDARVTQALAESARLSGNQLARTDDSAEAMKRLLLSIDLQTQWVSDATNIAKANNYLVETYRDLANVQRRLGKLSDAAESLNQASTLLNSLPDEPASGVNKTLTAATVSLALTAVHDECLKLKAALASAVKSEEQFTSVLMAGKGGASELLGLSLATARHGRILDDLERREEARVVFAKGIEQARRNLSRYPASRDVQFGTSRLLHWEARGLIETGTLTDQCEALIQEAVSMCEKLHADNPRSEGFQYNLADALRLHGRFYAATGQSETALASYDKGQTLAAALVEKSPFPGNRYVLAELLRDRAWALADAGDFSRAREDLTAAVTQATAAAQESPDNMRLTELLREVSQRLEELPQK